MAIVKLKYTKSKGKAKAHLRYITHRPGRDHARTTRVLFRQDGQTDKEWAYRLIDSATRGATFFKLVLSPDPKTEDKHKDLDLWRIATTTLRSLAECLGKPLSFVGVTHNDHTPNRHVHVLFADGSPHPRGYRAP